MPYDPQNDPYPDDWTVPGNPRGDTGPDDWVVPTPPTALSTAQPAPNPQPNAANPAISNRPTAPPDPLEAFWSRIPASRLAAVAWHPPIFLNSPAPYPSPSPAQLNDLLSATTANSVLGDIPKLLRERSAASGILGG